MASFTAYASKMKAEGLSDAAIAAFNYAYNELASGTSGCIPESTLGKITTVPDLDTIKATIAVDPSLLEQCVVLKLNVGLGTSMDI